MQEKDGKKEKASEKEKQKEERESKKAEKMTATKKYTGPKKVPTQEASAKSTNEKTRKGKGKATVKNKRFGWLSHMYAMVSEAGLYGRLDRMPLQTVDLRGLYRL